MPTHFALLIGSNGTNNPLQYAESDVVRLKSWLKSDSAWSNSSDDDIQTFLGSKKPSGRKKPNAFLQEQIDKFISDKGDIEDTVLFISFSGHASVNENDIPSFLFEGSAIPFQTILDKCIRVFSPANIFLLLDCCNTIDETKPQTSPKPLIDRIMEIFQAWNPTENILSPNGKRTIIFASSPGTDAYESSLVGGSIFLAEFMAVCGNGGNSSNVFEFAHGIISAKYITEFISNGLAGIQKPEFFGFDFPVKKLKSLDSELPNNIKFFLLDNTNIEAHTHNQDIEINPNIVAAFSLPIANTQNEPILSVDVYHMKDAILQIIVGEKDKKLSKGKLKYHPSKHHTPEIHSFSLDFGDPYDIRFLAVGENEQYIAVSNGENVVKIYRETDLSNPICQIPFIGKMVVSYNHTRLAFITSDKRCIIIATDSTAFHSTEDLQQQNLVDDAISAVFSPRHFYVALQNGSIQQFSLDPQHWKIGKSVIELPQLQDFFVASRMVVDPNEETLVAICSNNGYKGYIGVWSLKSHAKPYTVKMDQLDANIFKEVALSPDGKWLVAITDTFVCVAQKNTENTFIFQPQYSKSLAELSNGLSQPNEIFTCLAFSPESFLLPCIAIGSNYGAVYIWDFLNDNILPVQERNDCYIFRLIFTGINLFAAWLTAVTGKSAAVYRITPQKQIAAT